MRKPQPNEYRKEVESIGNDLATVELMLYRMKSRIAKNGNSLLGTKLWKILKSKLDLIRSKKS